MRPDDAAIRAFLGRAVRREALRFALEGAAAGIAVGAIAVLGVAGGMGRVALIASMAAGAMLVRLGLGDGFRLGWWRDPVGVAARVESRVPDFRNLLVTAAELLGTTRSRSTIEALVAARARSLSEGIDLSAVIPAGRRWTALAGAVAVALAASSWRAAASAMLPSGTPVAAAAGIERLDVIVTPPAYAGLRGDTLRNPDRIEVLAGTRIRLTIRSGAPAVRLDRVSGTMDLARSGDAHAIELIARESDLLAFGAIGDSGRVVDRRLVGLAVTADADPSVRLTTPGRDLFVSTVPPRLDVAVEAVDDHALASMAFRYTSVSGSGEQFTFTERELPLIVRRTDARTWTATASWRLDTLGLAVGDMIVYRAEAADRRPGVAPARSDSYVLEVVGPGAVAAEGFATDAEEDRYAVSQQMVILRTERLIAARARLADGAVADSARVIAAEQRRVRAEFVFMMGGELEDDEARSGTLMVDEHAEAEAETDLMAGRMHNRGRVEMLRAIRAMSQAASLLTNADLPAALAQERVALDNLNRAFSRSRILLRALTQRERLDLDRRLSGALADAAPSARAVPAAPAQARVTALRRVLADLASLSSGGGGVIDRHGLATAAIALVRVDPADDSLRAIAAAIDEAANRGDAVSGLPVVTMRLAARIRDLLPPARPVHPDPKARQLRGAMADALDRLGGRR